MLEHIWPAFWQAIFELLVLGLIAFRVNVVYQRFRQRSMARQELIDEIDAFTTSLYKPRKLYQSLIDGELSLSDSEKSSLQQRMIEELIVAEGQFRSLQVKLVPLYGFPIEMFAYYLAIWRYLKEIRKRMLAGDTLYFHQEQEGSSDAFYRLIDTFRYQILTAKLLPERVGLLTPPQETLGEMQREGNALYSSYFCTSSSPPVPVTESETLVG